MVVFFRVLFFLKVSLETEGSGPQGGMPACRSRQVGHLRANPLLECWRSRRVSTEDFTLTPIGGRNAQNHQGPLRTSSKMCKIRNDAPRPPTPDPTQALEKVCTLRCLAVQRIEPLPLSLLSPPHLSSLWVLRNWTLALDTMGAWPWLGYEVPWALCPPNPRDTMGLGPGYKGHWAHGSFILSRLWDKAKLESECERRSES